MSVIYINGSKFDIGIIKDINKSNTKMSVIIPGIVDGEAPETLKLGEDYITYSIDFNFHGTLKEQNDFEKTIINYCKEFKECYFVDEGDTLSNGVKCIFYDWKSSKNNQYNSFKSFNLVLVESGKLDM